ncbi:MinD/ParA family protein [Microbacterium lacus]
MPHDSESENGVLSDTANLDTTAINILGGSTLGSTEQVSVSMAPESDEEFTDDDVIGDEVSYFEADEDFVSTETAETEIVDDEIVNDEIVNDTVENPSEWVESGAIVINVADDVPAQEVHADADDSSDDSSDDSDDAELSKDADNVEDADVVEVDPDAQLVAELAASSFVRDGVEADRAVSATSAEPGDDLAVAKSTWDAAAEAAGFDAVQSPTPPQNAVVPPARLERRRLRQDVTLTSKRLGEFDAGRETSDLLTADRLLDPNQVVKSEPEGAWQHFVYSISGHRINLGDGKRARARKALDHRIAAPLSSHAMFVPVLSRKGGVGKTTVTTLLGMALADARDDRIIAVDANPDRGTLAERISRSSGKTVRDLVRARADVVGYNDLSSIVARDETRLDVLASDTDPHVSEAFSDRDYHDVASLAAHYYSIVLTDTGTGIVHSVMGATLDLADQLVVVSGLSVDEARLASETLTWLETNGYAEQVRGAIVVLNNSRPGTPLVRPEELEAHFRTRVRAVVRLPYDPHIAAGSAITFRDLRPETMLAARELAATLVEGLRALPSATAA